MKALVLKSSPKPEGNTSTMADHFVRGLRAVGHTDIAEFRLNDLDIRPCQACNACFRKPYKGCALDDDFMTIYPHFREADLVVLAAPVYWWHLCAQAKTFIDRMHPMLTYDRDHSLPTKDFVLLTAYFAEDPYGVELVLKTLESITGWAGMGFREARFRSLYGHVRDDDAKLEEVRILARAYSDWAKPVLTALCPLDGCTFRFRNPLSAARHLVMAAGDDHLQRKAENLSQIHTLQNTDELVAEALSFIREIPPPEE